MASTSAVRSVAVRPASDLEGEEVQEVVGDQLSIDVILRLASLQEAQRFRQMVVQDHRFVSQFTDQQVLLLDLFLKGQCTLKLFLCYLEL